MQVLYTKGMTNEIIAALKREGEPLSNVENMRKFFKVQPGGYGEGDDFLGITVPALRRVAKQYKDLSLEQIEVLLGNPYHEVRLLAAVILANRCRRASEEVHRTIFDFYLAHATQMNGWDIVDSSCRDVVGEYILKHPEQVVVLDRLAVSDNLWERRIAIVSTWALIRAGKVDDTYRIGEVLLHDKQDLIHKAVGWMLRETGKRDREQLRAFVLAHAHHMPRTALRYAIEHFSPEERAAFLAIKRT